jgi:hypothetical protein
VPFSASSAHAPQASGRRRRHGAAAVALSISVAACGARTATVDDTFDAGMRPEPRPEVCNLLDDDLNGVVDDGFRDELGRYVQLEHCGACGAACPATLPAASGVACALVSGSPRCVATGCERGFARSETGRCVPAQERLCMPCADDADCGDFPGAGCMLVGGERRCVIHCALGCPDGYVCAELDEGGVACVPRGGSCTCDRGDRFELACALTDPTGLRCPGAQTCDDGVLSTCTPFTEVCNEVDDDCDGQIDEGFRDARGAYVLDIHHCGRCGVDCTRSTVPEGDLVCGGDPFAPRCVLLCPDTLDGIQPGDRVDADLDIATGCECTVSSALDAPGPVGAEGQDLDVNCDGADGVVVESFYVSSDGDDTGPGSPTRPLRTIGVALRRAAESLGTAMPRPHVFVASGSYTETLEIPDGVKVHGGYRGDFRALEPSGFRTEVRAPAATTAPGGAALVARDVGRTDTVVEWMSLRGRDATAPSSATFGAVLVDPGPALSLRGLEIYAGVAGAGIDGANGAAGAPPMTAAAAGAPNRAAVEDARNACVRGEVNIVVGGAGGRNTCDATDVSGGQGGSAGCPRFMAEQPAGERGRGPAGGAGGRGGNDSQGPIRGAACAAAVCCGLADFTVYDGFQGPRPGEAGTPGTPGTAGRGCREALGRFEGDRWLPDVATAGSDGTPGSGGGGGGAGGGSEYESVPPNCAWPDALGGGGGGGGAGGCGGRGGRPGTSGGPSVALLLLASRRLDALPTLRGLLLAPSDGGRGGDGGAGGEGGAGGLGAPGGDVPRAARSTPPLAGGFPGARGGAGGDGGAGGAGGGGCGGASVGIWVTSPSVMPPADWRRDNTFRLGRGGAAGRGGGGVVRAADGAAGEAFDVLVR